MTIDPAAAAPDAAKNELRRIAMQRRRTLSPADRAAAREANAAHLLEYLSAHSGPVCGYRPLPSEPLAESLLLGLAAAGIEVLVPVVTGAAPLDWTPYRPDADMGDVYLPEGERLGPAAVTTAAVVLVPAFAVDRRGVRLGRGGGHYDRTLALVGPRTQRIATLFDGEHQQVDLPTDRFDQPVGFIVTPGTGVRQIDTWAAAG